MLTIDSDLARGKFDVRLERAGGVHHWWRFRAGAGNCQGLLRRRDAARPQLPQRGLSRGCRAVVCRHGPRGTVMGEARRDGSRGLDRCGRRGRGPFRRSPRADQQRRCLGVRRYRRGEQRRLRLDHGGQFRRGRQRPRRLPAQAESGERTAARDQRGLDGRLSLRPASRDLYRQQVRGARVDRELALQPGSAGNRLLAGLPGLGRHQRLGFGPPPPRRIRAERLWRCEQG